MPTYVYKFIDSGETIEVQQSFDDDTLTEYPHPISGEPQAVKKVFLPVGVTFKGNGFYKTDSRSGAKRSTSATSSTESSTSSTSESSSPSTTPAVASDAKSSSSAPSAPTSPST